MHSLASDECKLELNSVYVVKNMICEIGNCGPTTFSTLTAIGLRDVISKSGRAEKSDQ